MSFGSAAAAMVDHALGYLSDGLQVTLRRLATLKNRVTGKALTALTVVSPVLAGATSIDLTGTNLDGELPAGARFQIAATTYTATNTREASKATNGQLVGVTFTPGLAADAGAGAAVMLVQPYSDQSYTALRAKVEEGTTDKKTRGQTRRVRLSAAGTPPPRAPRAGDLLIDGNSTEPVAMLDGSQPGQAISWVVVAGTGT